MKPGSFGIREHKPMPAPRAGTVAASPASASASAGASSSGSKAAPAASSSSSPASRAKAPSGMRPHEGPLSGYLLARAAMGRKIDDAAESTKLPDGHSLRSENVLADLRAANDSLEETRRLLPNGRGNVKGDILATGGEASRRYAAGAFMAHYYQEKKGINPAKDSRSGMQTETAVSLITGQATCGGSALVAAHVHAPKLGKGQAVVAVANVEVDHMWTESIRRNSDRGNDQIIDRWTAGPAVLRQDSSYGLDRNVQDAYILNPANRAQAIGSVNRMLKEIKGDSGLNARFRDDMVELHRMDYRFAGKIWDEENVLGEGFRRNAGEILHRDSSQAPGPDKNMGTGKQAPALPFIQEVLAAGAAKSLGEGVRGSAEKAPGILETAKRMFPKPSGDQAGPATP